MNKIYKVIWNYSTQRWDVVSELSGNKKKCKSARLNLALAAALLAGTMVGNCSNVLAADIPLGPAWSPGQNNNLTGSANVDGFTASITGPSTVTSSGSGIIYMDLERAKAAGYITSGDELAGLLYIDTGGRTKSIQYYDSVTGAFRTIQVYDNNAFSQGAAGTAPNDLVEGFSPTADFFYNTRFVTVTNGGTANIDVDSKFIGRDFKDSQLAVAKGQGTTVNWNSKNEFYFQSAATVNNGLTYTKTINSMEYAGSFIDWQGKTYQVNSLADLQQYNDYLTQAIVEGKLSASKYESEFNKAIITTKHNYDVDRTAGGTINPDIYQGEIGTLAILEGTDGGVARLSSTGKITGVLPGYTYGGGIIARKGGTGINEGVIDAIGISMRAYENSLIVNSGTIYVWDNNNRHSRHGEGMVAIDLGSRAENNGVINVRPFKNTSANPAGINTAMLVAGGGEGVNNHIINITADASTIDSKGKTRGISVGSGGIFTNASNGLIKIGVAEDGSAAHSAVGSVAIEVAKGATRVVNEGTILLGEGAQGNYGISATNAGVVNVTNSGTITIEGHDSDAPALNVGMFANGSSGLKNTGTINVNGLNSAGLQAINAGLLSSAGTVNVGGEGLSRGFRNYGVWVEGTGSQADISGTINLDGVGAVGGFAKDGGNLTLSGNGAVIFRNSNQVGFYVHGKGSAVDNTGTGVMDVSTENSTLFRIASGATFRGATNTSSEFTASGKNSYAFIASGKSEDGSASALISGNMKVNLKGEGATAILIEGGAQGTIEHTAIINMDNTGVIAGIVDGNGYDISGQLIYTKDSNTLLTTNAQLNSSQDNVTGYISRNGATLNNTGSITFTGENSTGIRVEEGSVGINSGNINFTAGTDNIGVWVDNGRFENTGNRIAVNGVALFVEGAQSQITSTGGDIVAVDGEAAIKLGAGASLHLKGSGLGTVEGQKNAHGILLDTGAVGLIIDGAKINVNTAGTMGHGIENRAEIEGIQLTSTTEINAADGIGIRTSASLAKTNSGTINVDGSGIALAFQKADGSETDNNLDMSDSGGLVINLKGTGGTGIFANTKDGAVVKSGASVNVTQADGGSALVVNNAASEVVQSGNLISASLNHAVVDASKALSFTNTGQIKAASAAGTAMAFDDAVNTTVLNDSGAEIQGVVALNGGDNTFTNKGSITGTVSAKDGNNTLLFDDGSTLTGEATAGRL